jgi:anthranilate synthase/aminodeoxychorismate synthase-like glutamine amidotransferase
MKILLIDNYDSFTYNLYHYLSELKCKVEVHRNDQIKINDIVKKNYKKIVISPGPGNPKQAGDCIKIVRKFYKFIPILGVCLGHQVIGEAFNSKIIPARKLMHGKTSIIEHKGIGIFNGLKKGLSATRYHSLIIDRNSLSKDLIVTAKTRDNIIMGIMHKKYNIHGVQFHPESIKTPTGLKILKNFINYKLK